MTADDFNTLAWRDFIHYAWHDRDLRAAFMAETGVSLDAERPLTAMERLVDNATGYVPPGDAAQRFIDWITIHHWGVESAPKSWRDAHPEAVSP